MTDTEAGLSPTARVSRGSSAGPVIGEARLHIVFGTGQVGSALVAYLAGLGLAVRTVSRHRPHAAAGGVDWRAVHVTDPLTARTRPRVPPSLPSVAQNRSSRKKANDEESKAPN
jgi:hypothetical protein